MKFIKEIVQDNDGVFWIGVTLGGVVRFDGYSWEKFTPDDSELLSDFVLDLAVDRANRKWITTNAGVSVFNDRRWVNYTVQNCGLPDDIVPAIAIDKNNTKWFGTLNGLCSFDGEEWRTWNTSNSPLPSNQINDIAIDEEGLLWIATSGGAAVFDGVDRWVVFTSKNSPLPAGNIYKIANDKRGNHWFGNDSKGLARLMGFKMPAKAAAPEVAQQSEPETKPAGKPAESKPSDEKVRINPHLSDGYVTLSIESKIATVTFTNSSGKVVKTVTNYKSGQKIAINRMPKGMYTVGVRTERGERKIKFNLK
jgi:ligand-binding sensor domain-containing protein